MTIFDLGVKIRLDVEGQLQPGYMTIFKKMIGKQVSFFNNFDLLEIKIDFDNATETYDVEARLSRDGIQETLTKHHKNIFFAIANTLKKFENENKIFDDTPNYGIDV